MKHEHCKLEYLFIYQTGFSSTLLVPLPFFIILSHILGTNHILTSLLNSFWKLGGGESMVDSCGYNGEKG